MFWHNRAQEGSNESTAAMKSNISENKSVSREIAFGYRRGLNHRSYERTKSGTRLVGEQLVLENISLITRRTKSVMRESQSFIRKSKIDHRKESSSSYYATSVGTSQSEAK